MNCQMINTTESLSQALPYQLLAQGIVDSFCLQPSSSSMTNSENTGMAFKSMTSLNSHLNFPERIQPDKLK